MDPPVFTTTQPTLAQPNHGARHNIYTAHPLWGRLLCLFTVLMWSVSSAWAIELPKEMLQKIQTTSNDQQDSELDRLREKDRLKKSVASLDKVPDQTSRSPLEEDLSVRAKVPLAQFGYDLFHTGKEQEGPVTGAAPDSYLLGVGDELILTYRGSKENRSTVIKVDLEGRVMVPSLMEPIMAMGRTFGEFREELKEKVRTTQVGTEVFVSIGAFRFFTVYVIGEVTKPGVHRVTGLSTLLDALALAGGLRKTGSSRSIQLHRDGKVLTVDLYALFLKDGGGVDPTLTAGDRIVVPPLGSVVAVTGLVKRPGIYELPSQQTTIPLMDLMSMAGGLVNPRGNRYSLLSPDAQDRDSLAELNATKNPQIGMGNIVMVESKSGPTLMGEVGLAGHTTLPHSRSLASARTVRHLLSDPELMLPDPYLPFGVIYRTNAKTRNRAFVPVDLGLILKRAEMDQPLINHDILIILGVEDIRFLSSERVAAVLNKKPPGDECIALSRLDAVAASSDSMRFSNLFQFRTSGMITGKGAADSPTPQPMSSDSLRLANMARLQTDGSMPVGKKGLMTLPDPTNPMELPDPTNPMALTNTIPDLKVASRLQPSIPVALPTETESAAQQKARGACPAIFNQFPDLLPFLLDNSVLLEGNVDHPSLFPILPGARMTDIIPVAQGVVGAAQFDKNTTLHFQIDRKFGSKEATREIIALPKTDLSSFNLQPGDVLRFKSGQVQMVGHVKIPQQRSLQSIPTIRHFLLDTDNIQSDPYLLFGVLRRMDPATHNRILTAVNLDSIIKGDDSSSPPLQDRDILIVLSNHDVKFLANPLVQSILLGKPTTQNCKSLQNLTDLMSASDAFRFSNAINLSIAAFEQNKAAAKRDSEKNSTLIDIGKQTTHDKECPTTLETYPELLPFLLENATLLTGEIRTPGVFPVLSGTKLSALVQSSGGMTSRANLKQVELSRATIKQEQGASTTTRTILDFSNLNFDSLQLIPGDVLRFNPIFSDREIGYVRLEGEFIRPGLYDIRREDKLSDIITRAGGVTPHAYPYGAIFTRTSIQQIQKESFVRVAQELEMSLASLMMTSKEQTDKAGVMESGQAIIQSLRNVDPLGRMVVEANPQVLQTNPELDIFLVAGDRIFMPKQPSEVSVSGAVLNPGSFLYAKNQSANDYIKWAGGYKDNANQSSIFIVLPDGKAQPMFSLTNWWDQQAGLVPGSTIVVPLDPKPFEIMGSIKDVTQILSQWAITIASLSVISSR